MAYYSLWKWFSPWSKRDYPNMIYWFRRYVLMTEEERKEEDRKRRERAEQVLAELAFFNAALSKHSL